MENVAKRLIEHSKEHINEILPDFVESEFAKLVFYDFLDDLDICISDTSCDNSNDILDCLINTLLSENSPDTSYIIKWTGMSIKHIDYIDEALKYEPENSTILFDIAYKLVLQDLYEYFYHKIFE